ncbi:hypothetical protein [Bacillus rubiinfantis]|uniref:hypothetical protein n=1 Tax=Bacillus rubiinfantis TaxID=1499680 RepID=UPI0005A81BBE|nr:hypothetical protein [Bacillus rubiinfantis]
MSRKIVILLSGLYVLFMSILAVYFFMNGETFKATVAVGGIACGAIPLFLALFTRLTFNLPIVISYIIFLFGSQYLGSIRSWYGLGWWDTFIHFISGGIIAFTGVALYERLIKRNAGDKISPWFVFWFTFSFSALGAVLWEIYEFSSDQLFGMTLQGGGNKDTMIDMIAGLSGGLIIACTSGIRTMYKLKKQAKNH